MKPNTDPQPQPEELNIGKLLAPDQKEWHRAYDILVPVAKAAAAAASRNYDESFLKDIAQIALIEFHKTLRPFEKKARTADLENIVACIAIRRAKDYVRKETGSRGEKKPSKTTDEAPPPTESADANPDQAMPEHIIEHKEQLRDAELAHREAERLGDWKETFARGLEELEKCEDKMGKIYRTLVERFYYDGCTIEQLAEELQMPKGTVGVTKQRALDRFKEIISSISKGREFTNPISSI